MSNVVCLYTREEYVPPAPKPKQSTLKRVQSKRRYFGYQQMKRLRKEGESYADFKSRMALFCDVDSWGDAS